MEVLTSERSDLGESPLWHAGEAAFYWVDIEAKLVLRYDPRSEQVAVVHRGDTVTALSELASGGLVMVTPHGLYIASDAPGRTLAALSLSDQVRTNDGKCDPEGRIWFGTMDLETTRPIGELFVFDGGRTRLVEDQIILSNGLGWSPDGDSFYHVDTVRRLIYQYDYELQTGGVANRRVLVDLGGSMEAPDGLTVDVDGNLWVAMWDGWCIDVFDSSGERVHKESLPVQRPTSVAFGGSDLSHLYVTTAAAGLAPDELGAHPHAGKLLRLEPGVRGVPVGVFELSR